MSLQILCRALHVYQKAVIVDQSLCRKFATNNVARITWNVKWVHSTKKPEQLSVSSTQYCSRHENFNQLSQKRFIHRDEFKTVDKTSNKRDGVSEEFTLVYDVNLSSNLRLGLFLPLTIIMVICAGIVVSSYIFGVEYPENLPGTSFKTRHVLIVLALCLFSVFSLPTAKNYNKSIVRIYSKKSSDDFIAIIRKNITQQEQLPFKKVDAKGYFGRGSKGNFIIKGRSFMVYEEDFAKFGNQILFNDWFGSYLESRR